MMFSIRGNSTMLGFLLISTSLAFSRSSVLSFERTVLGRIQRGGGFSTIPSGHGLKVSLRMSDAVAATPDDGAAAPDDGAAAPADISGKSQGGGTATIPSEIFNLVKNIVGAGVLSLPAGVAAFGNAPSAIVPATLLIALLGGLSAYCFSLIGRVCSETGAQTYREAWDKSVGTKSSWIPAASCTAKTSLAVTAYSMILADTFVNLLATAGITMSRSNTLFGITGIVLLPLCLLKNLSSLAPFSLLGVMGMVFTTIAMAVRYLGGSYKAPVGKYLPDLASHLLPAFGTKGAKSVFSAKAFILVCTLSTAFMAHFNAPKYYSELKDNTVKRFNQVVYSSFGISVGFFAAIAALGFATFGSASQGLILNNYSNKDALMSFSRIAVAVSIIFSYPLAFVGVREGVLDLANIPQEKRTNGLLNKLTVAILAGVTGMALVVKDLSFLLSLGGATLGNALIYVYPALMFRAVVKKKDGENKGLKKEVMFAMATAAMGIVVGGIGGTMAIKSLS